MPDLIRTVVSFVVVLGVLVFVHEMGHYLAARWRGVHIEAFSIGFGRPIASWTDRVGTQWKVAWLPLGGYVKLHGQERPDHVAPEVRNQWLPGRTFHEKSVGSRAIVVAAGPVANFLLAMLLFAGLFAVVGEPVPSPRIGEVVAGTAAARAGLAAGDTILSVDGRPVHRFDDIQRIVSARPDATVPFDIRHDGQDRTVRVSLGSHEVEGRRVGLLGIRGGMTEFRPVGAGRAVIAGVVQTGRITAQTIQGLWQMITGQRGTEDLGGPLGIARLSGQAAEMGLGTLIGFIAMLSINLGLVNLFPVPILDGGYLLFYLTEAVTGRPVPRQAQEYGFRAGFFLLACLFVFATWNDLSRFGLFHWVTSHIGHRGG